MAEDAQIWQKIYLQTQDSEQTSNRINSKKSSARYGTVKLLKTKEKHIYLESSEREITPYLQGNII